MEEVFTNYDILWNILKHLDIFNLNAIASVSKLFNQLNVDMYTLRLKSTIIEPAQELFSNYITSIQPTINLINLNNNNHNYNLITDDDLYDFMTKLNNFLSTILDSNLWIALVNNFILMENIFCHLSNIVVLFKYLKFNTFDKELDCKMNANFKKIRKYLYVENPEFYTVEDLKLLCRFKNIKKNYKLKRSYLIKALKRPKDELYFFE